MARQFLRFFFALTPLYVFVWWMLGPVTEYLFHKDPIVGALMLLGGVAALAVAQGLVFKIWLLPVLARAMSERLYAGSYLPEDDPLATLSGRIVSEHRHDLLPELERVVESDRRRVRAWLELARVLSDELKDSDQAAEKLLRGATFAPNKEDASMLMWRAVSLYKKSDANLKKAVECAQKIVDSYPHTVYGKLAGDFLKKKSS